MASISQIKHHVNIVLRLNAKGLKSDAQRVLPWGSGRHSYFLRQPLLLITKVPPPHFMFSQPRLRKPWRGEPGPWKE